MTLAEFIEARLSEDEQAATQGGINGARWDFTGSNCEVRVRNWHGDLSDIVARCREGRAIDMSNTIHIARQDPARVLRQVTAMRAILADIVPLIDGMDAELNQERGPDHYYTPTGESDHLLKFMAAIWSDHPDYQQEWTCSHDTG